MAPGDTAVGSTPIKSQWDFIDVKKHGQGYRQGVSKFDGFFYGANLQGGRVQIRSENQEIFDLVHPETYYIN